jgi:hypothetical protein
VKQDDTLVANTAPARSKWPQLWLKGANTRKGRLRRQVARAFIALGSPLTVTDILPRCYYDGKFSCGRRQKLRRALLRQAIPIGRQLHRRGRPLLWAPSITVVKITTVMLGPNSLCDWQLALEVFGGIKEALPAASQRQPGEVLEFVLGAIRAADAKVVEG